MILIVDDSPAIQNQVSAILLERGHANLAVASSAEEARASIDAGDRFALVLLDVHLPGEDGLSLCRFLSEHPDLRDVPVLVMTADQNEELLERAFAAGARDYVRKPLSRRELVVRVEAALHLRRELLQKAVHLAELRELNTILQRANVDLQEKASIDALTGLANRRHLDQFLELAWQDARLKERALSLLMIDIDYFKLYNDANGHQAGDEALVRVARAIDSALIQGGHLAARYGGEEFSVVLPATALASASLVAERVRLAVQGLAIPHAAAPDKVLTVSIGVGTRLPLLHEPVAELVKRADRGLYAAKAAGRNRVVVDDGARPEHGIRQGTSPRK